MALFNVKELSVAKLNASPSDSGQSNGATADDVNANAADAEQVSAAIAIVRTINPDILVLQEIDQGSDQDPASVARLFAERLRNDPETDGASPVDYPYVFSAPSNTGRLTGIDLSGDDVIATQADRGTRIHGDDSFGFGTYPGQYSMAVLSRTPFDLETTRTFQRFLWKDLPGNHMDTELKKPFLSADAREIFRLSSKSHWDLVVKASDTANAPTLRLLVSHPTPPVFDGPEDRNGRRNFDELLFWAHYLNNMPELVDDQGNAGGYDTGPDPHSASDGTAPQVDAATTAGFIIAGDLNAFPQASAEAGDSIYDNRNAISQLLEHPTVQDSGSWLTSQGALAHSGEPAGPPLFREQSTAGFGNGRRIDYLLPSTSLEIEAGGVFWPDADEDPQAAALANAASDHRLVWLDVVVPSFEASGH